MAKPRHNRIKHPKNQHLTTLLFADEPGVTADTEDKQQRAEH
jgi:hypothetical protein